MGWLEIEPLQELAILGGILALALIIGSHLRRIGEIGADLPQIVIIPVGSLHARWSQIGRRRARAEPERIPCNERMATFSFARKRSAVARGKRWQGRGHAIVSVNR